MLRGAALLINALMLILVEKTLTVSKVSNLITKREGSSCNNSKKAGKRVHAARRCRRCSEIGYNSRTCTVEIEDLEDSNKSK